MDGRAGQPARPLGGIVLAVGLLVLVFGGYAYIMFAEPGKAHRRAQLVAPATAPRTPVSPPAGGAAAGSTAASGAARPVRLSIDAIGLDASLQSLRRSPNGSLQPPTGDGGAGWYAQGTLPGAVGAAVIVGYAESPTGAAVFFRLRNLQLGDQILVRRQDGAVLHFEVDDIHAYYQAVPPSSAVYAPAAVPTLRLISLGNATSKAGYQQNVMVTAHLT